MHSTKLLQYLCVLKTRNNRTNFQFSKFVLIKFLILFIFLIFQANHSFWTNTFLKKPDPTLIISRYPLDHRPDHHHIHKVQRVVNVFQEKYLLVVFLLISMKVSVNVILIILTYKPEIYYKKKKYGN
jgi:hypothetical protein